MGYKNLITPLELKKELVLSEKAKEVVLRTKKEIEDILDKKDSRKIIIAGPCSIHDVESALEYAKKLKELADKVKDKFLIVMRCYFEKQRSTTGWKGFILDPDLDDSNNVEKGLTEARRLLIKINELGVPVGTEFFQILTPQYIGDLISWSTIGARSVESQIHRDVFSGLEMPVGFKNTTNGDIKIAVSAMIAASNPQSYIGVNDSGKVSLVSTKGNKYIHLILRGGKTPNYDDIQKSLELLKENKLLPNIIVDCSHGNSGKDYKKQPDVFKEVIDKDIVGVMLESNLEEGNQPISKDLKKGVSITDSCISFEETKKIILEAYDILK